MEWNRKGVDWAGMEWNGIETRQAEWQGELNGIEWN